MEQVKDLFKTKSLLISLLLLLGMLAMASCQTAEPDEVAQVADAEPILLETVTAVLPTEEPEAGLITEPTPIDNCLDCHTNKELLIQTADPEVEVLSENEGEG